MNDLYNLVQGVFPDTEILLMYYCGSISYGIDGETSDKDVTVVLNGFKGNIHITIGEYDLFVFSRERFIRRQKFDESVIAYHRAAADNLMSIKETLIYINPEFQTVLDELLLYDDREFMLKHIEAELEYGKMRIKISPSFKSHYHVFRIRGMVDHYDKTGRYELIVEEPWYSKMMDYKVNWNNDIGQSYINEIQEQLHYLEDYRDRMIRSGMG